MKTLHIWFCMAFVAVAVVLVAVGADSLAFIPALGCAAMTGMMVWMMVRR